MTVSSTTRQAGPYHGNDIVAAFPFAFKVFSAADVVVIETDPNGIETTKTLTTDYTVTLNLNQDVSPGGTVTAVTAPATNFKWTITSDIAALQSIDLTNLGGFYPAVINGGFDKLTILVQQLLNKAARAIKIPISDNSGEITIPTSTIRANRFLAFDGAGNPIAATGLSSTPVSAYMTPVVAAANAPAARALLGFDSASGGDFLVFGNTATAAEAALRVNTNQATSGISYKLSNSALNVQATLRGRSDGGVTVYVGQTAGAASTSGVQAVDVDAVGNVQVGIPGIAGGRTLQVINTNTGAGSYVQLYGQTDAGTLTLQVNTVAGGGAASFFSSASGGFSLGTTVSAALNFLTNNLVRLSISAAGVVNAAVSLTENNTRVFSRNSANLGSPPAAQSWTAAGTYTFAHNLGAIPVLTSVWLECTTADAGYAVGDRLFVQGVSVGTAVSARLPSLNVAADATNVYVQFNNTPYVCTKSGASSANITTGRWNVVVRAWG